MPPLTQLTEHLFKLLLQTLQPEAQPFNQLQWLSLHLHFGDALIPLQLKEEEEPFALNLSHASECI